MLLFLVIYFILICVTTATVMIQITCEQFIYYMLVYKNDLHDVYVQNYKKGLSH